MTYKKHLDRFFVYLIVISRLFFGILIFTFVWIATLGSFFTDWADGEVFKRAGFPRHVYEFCDKILDIYWYVLIFIYLFIHNPPSLDIFVFLFIFRMVGEFIYIYSRNEKIFFLFPNVFEILFYAYLISSLSPELNRLMFTPESYYLVAIIIPIVLLREYILHIKKYNLSWFFTGKTTYWIKE